MDRICQDFRTNPTPDLAFYYLDPVQFEFQLDVLMEEKNVDRRQIAHQLAGMMMDEFQRRQDPSIHPRLDKFRNWFFDTY